jgi:hypothetical protein
LPHDQYSYKMYWQIKLQNPNKFWGYKMYLNSGKLKAPTFYQFPPLYLNPGESSLVTFTVKGFRVITQCPKFAVE